MRWNHKLDQSDATPKYEQIVNFVAGAIERGQLKVGERIPSSAELAKKLGINNSTVVRAFRELEQQGLITSQVGKGSFVAGRNGHTAPVRESRQPQAPAATPEIQRSLGRMRLSYINGMNQLAAIPSPEGTLDITGGVPSPDSVDKKWFAALVSKSLALDPMKVFGYAHLGLAELRAAIAKRLNSQGYSVSERNIIITSGSQEALTLVANWSREEGRIVFVETPSYIGIPLAFLNLGNRVEGAAQDQNGSIQSGLGEVSRAPRSLVYVCPDFHNPTGRTMPANEREELGRFAARNDTIVVVDDIFRDMRFKGKDIPSLYESLPSGRRILVGSFSKSFIPGIRVGFMVVEQPMLDTFAQMKRYFNLGGAVPSQIVMAAALEGGYEQHLDRMRIVYRERCNAICAALQETMPDNVSFTRPEGSFQLWVRMPQGYSSIMVYLKALQRGVRISPGPHHDIDGRFQNCFRLGYTNVDVSQIRKGVEILGEIVRETIDAGPQALSATGLALS